MSKELQIAEPGATEESAPARKGRGKAAKAQIADVADLTAAEAEALTEQVLAAPGYGISEQAFSWDSLPCAYVAPGTRPQTVLLPAGRVSRTELAFRNQMRAQFATLNERAKAEAKTLYEAELMALNLSEKGEQRYREANPFWEIPVPPPLAVVGDSRDVRGSGVIGALPEGLERRAPAA